MNMTKVQIVISNGFALFTWQMREAAAGVRAGGEKTPESKRRGGMPSADPTCIYAYSSQEFAKLTKMSILFVKPLDRCF